ncbi:MAG: DNA-3-methyladenine glycosylase [Halobacteriovoraceae bacterium]|nr:DNA-3-methyladenine glycosylase [Halobacteriovoraceae bacterium]
MSLSTHLLSQKDFKRKILPRGFYLNDDVVSVARSLIGKGLCTYIHGKFTRGIIVETEAYNGLTDKACHSYGGKRTPRTSVMYEQGGVSYVYLCYGMHHLFNIVTNKKGCADAVLIRAIHPTHGEKNMLKRRGMKKMAPGITAGPARMGQAMGINTKYNGYDLIGKNIFLDRGCDISPNKIQKSTRIGIAYAQEDALLPWRFYLRDDPYISRK